MASRKPLPMQLVFSTTGNTRLEGVINSGILPMIIMPLPAILEASMKVPLTHRSAVTHWLELCILTNRFFGPSTGAYTARRYSTQLRNYNDRCHSEQHRPWSLLLSTFTSIRAPYFLSGSLPHCRLTYSVPTSKRNNFKPRDQRHGLGTDLVAP